MKPIMNCETNSTTQTKRGYTPRELLIVRLFWSSHYQRHNQRRQEHLACLGLNVANSSVLEVGAGIGDHTSFFLDRGCCVVSTEARPENLKLLKIRYPDMQTEYLDMDNPDDSKITGLFDIVYCYGLLYHLEHPNKAIEFMDRHCCKMLLLETCVSFGDGELINPVVESAESPTESVYGRGCRPTRKWIYNQLKKYFEFVYMPITQPNHEEFPIDWSFPPSGKFLLRAVFVASREQLSNKLLVEGIPMQQKRHCF